jgi:uncharacterized integral membrane protein
VRRFSRAVDAGTTETFQPKLWAIVVALVLIAAYIVAFVVKNDAEVNVHFVFFTARTSVIWLILLSLVIGIVGGLLLSQLYRRRRGHESRETSNA